MPPPDDRSRFQPVADFFTGLFKFIMGLFTRD